MLPLYLSLLIMKCVTGELSMLGPTFIVEPPSVVRYAGGAGVRVRCAARADPPPSTVWLADDSTVLRDMPGIRRIYNNGTLEILPTSAYDVSPTTVRCRATNAHGVTLSRDVTLQPVSDGGWEAIISAGTATAGGIAAVTCGASRDAALVRPALWYKSDTVLHIDPPTPSSRYIVAGNTLLIRDVTPADAGSYSCLARHTLTATTKRARPAHLTVTQTSATSAPRLAAAGGEMSVPAGQDVCLPCAAAEHPQPHYTWYRERDGRLQPVDSGGTVWTWAGGAAACVRGARVAAAGLWICKAYNVYGDATAHLTLHVRDTLTVTVTPSVVVADTGSTVTFNCTASIPGAALSWLHDAAAAGSGSTHIIRGVARAHRGVYQCIARTPNDNAQATAELRLGASAPELHYTFIEQALRSGGSVSLRCAASASPPPRFTWLLDDQPIDHYRAQHRYFISEETSVAGDVVSVLNVSSVATGDGGRYTCRAHNDLGQVQHSARLNIYGPPSIRALGPVRVVAGANATIFCPYAGYPISSISWWRRGASVAVGGTGRVSARGAELRLTPALPADAGHYACAVAAPSGPAARRDIDIQVRNPPKISPFIFSSELTEGSSVQVLCGVSSGDKPMYFSWLKDGAPLPANLQIEEKSLDEFSLLIFSDLSARHSGEYACRVSNHAATVNFTATLNVKVAPSWATEPMDSAVLLGAPLVLECVAKGHPSPAITWYRRIAESTSLGSESEQWEIVHSGEWGSSEGAVRARNGTLTASTATRTHQGIYRCVADNGVGPPLVKHVNVTVHEPAHFESAAGNASCVRGQSATLACHALGDAPLTVHWSHRGSRLDLTSYRWSVSEVRTSGGLRSTLTLRAAERVDAGEYRCHATNQYGRTEMLMYLHVEEPPSAPTGLRLGGVGSRWVRVAWTAPSHSLHYAALYTALHALPAPSATQNTANLTLDPSEEDRIGADGQRMLSARLEGLRPAVTYSLRLAAANHVGQSPHSEPLVFTTLEQAPSGSPQNVRARAASPGELHVSWSAPPQDSWNGELLGYAVTWRELGRFDDGDEAGGRGGSATARGWSAVQLTLGGLRSFARYALTARAYNRAGAGPHSPTVYASTADGVPEVAPSSVLCEAISARSVRVRWAPLSTAHTHALRGYDLHYAPLHFSSSWSDSAEWQTARASLSGEATLQGLRAATNYSVWVRARTDSGLGPPSPPVYCTTGEDVPEAVDVIRALATGVDAVRVTWLAPTRRAGRLTHYTLYTKELGKYATLTHRDPHHDISPSLPTAGHNPQSEYLGGPEESHRTFLSNAEYNPHSNMKRYWRYCEVYKMVGDRNRVGGEWAQRVEASEESEGLVQEEIWREVRGLRLRTVYEFWVRASTAAGAGPPSRPVTAAPSPAVSARISSFSRIVYAAWGTRVRLRCSAVGAPPLRWRWAPLPHAHTISDDGDLIIHKVEAMSSGNYTCIVRNAGGSDAVGVSLAVRAAPAPPAPRLARAEPHALHLAWDPPHDGGAPILGYTIWWSRGDGATPTTARSRRVPAADTTLALSPLACGARYRVTLQAHNAIGSSHHSQPLLASTRGDKAKPPPGAEFVWANSSSLRLNLLAWGTRCPISAWSITLRPAAGGAWQDLLTDGEAAEANNLRPGAWYEVRVVARSLAGDTVALYKAATHTLNGERIGEPVEIASEARSITSEGGVAGTGGTAFWHAGLAPALLGGGLAVLLAALAGLVLARRRQATSCLRRDCSLHQVCQPHPQLYTTEPSKRNGKALTPPDVSGDLEISPYATFSMAGGATGPGAGGTARGGGEEHSGCALHLRTFGRAESMDLAAPPPRPNLLGHNSEYGRSRDSDSESSGSPCAACAAELYRLPAAHLSDTLPAVESSAEDTVYGGATSGAGSAASRVTRGVRHPARARRRRDHTRHETQPTVRYFATSALRSRPDPL